jgi:polar amino acid transport system substrate-binding protein
MRRTISLSFIFLLVSIINIRSVGAEEINFALVEWPPHTSQTMDGYGVAAELVTTIANEMNIDPKYNFYPLKRVFGRLEDGSHWAAFPGSYTEGRAKKFFYSDAIFPQVDRFFYYKQKPDVNFRKLNDLKQFVIGGTKGFWYEDKFKKAGLNTYYVSEDLLAIKMLIGGRVDLVAIHEVVGWQLIKKYFPNEAQNFGVLEKPLKTKPNYLLASKQFPNSKILLKRFNQALEQIKANGKYDKIANKYNLLS